MASTSYLGVIALLLVSLSASNGREVRSHYRITTILNKPVISVKEDEALKHGNDRYEGFIPDLLQALSEEVGLKFDYSIHVVADGKYGSTNDNKTWNGMIGELKNNAADIAAADLTITAFRSQVVDFTHPFLTSGIGILMKKPEPNIAVALDPAFFLTPFTKEVWICIIISFLSYSIIFFILGRFSSVEWMQNETTSERVNNLAVCNSLFFTFSSLTLQNAKVSPRGCSTRFLASIWWVFSLLIIAAYIANLAAIIIKHQMELQVQELSIKNLDDLVSQDKVQYGTLAGGSTYSFFRRSVIPQHNYVFQQMELMTPSPYMKSYSEGIQRVKRGNFALFMEHASIAFQTSTDCSLMSVGDLLDFKGYGLAFRKGSPLLQTFSQAILKLQETGVLAHLRNKWWGGSKSVCDDGQEVKEQVSLTLHNLHGPFTLLPLGIVIAIVLAVVELCCRARNSRGEGESTMGEVVREAKFAICGSGSNPRAGDKHNGPHGEGIILERQDAI